MSPSALQPGLIWSFELRPGEAVPTEECVEDTGSGFRWIHLNLAHQGTIRWITHAKTLPPAVKEMLLSPDIHQRAVIEDGVISCVFHDFERDFERIDESSKIGTVHFALSPGLMITARQRPVRSPDVIRDKLSRGTAAWDAPKALDLLIGTIAEIMADTIRTLGLAVQQAEDDFLEDRAPPTAHHLIDIRRRMSKVHRLLSDMHGVLHRLEEDKDLPEPVFATIEKQSQRLRSLDSDALSVLGQLRLLREEIDLQADQRTNQNLYILSILTALMLPATLVTGLFGMNTGGLPWASTPYGTVLATALAFGAAAGTYWLLRWMGFMRR